MTKDKRNYYSDCFDAIDETKKYVDDVYDEWQNSTDKMNELDLKEIDICYRWLGIAEAKTRHDMELEDKLDEITDMINESLNR